MSIIQKFDSNDTLSEVAVHGSV
ncbi:RidA family protein, partial [Moraxella catarrhalis]|nr:RidA family protein [Moraxella catarrhalis]